MFPMRNASGLTLLLCALAALTEGFDTQSMGVAAPRVIAEFGLSTSQAAIIFSSTTFGLFLGAGAGGRIADHWGRKRALIMSMLLFGLFSILTAMAVGPRTLFAARLLTGLGLGGAMPNFISLCSEATQDHRRVSIVTLIMAAMPFGGAVAALTALGAQAGWGWRTIFYVGGIAPILLALLMAVLLPSMRSSAAAPDPGHRLPRIEGVGAALVAGEQRGTTLLLWVAYFFTQLVLLLMLNWLPSLILGFGFTRSEASWAAVCFNLGGSFGAGFLGRLHAGRHRRLMVAVTYCAIALALVAVSTVGKAFYLAAAACAVAGVFIIGAQLILFALAPLYYKKSIRGTGVGASVSMGRLGSVMGPLYAGALLAGGGSSAAVLLGILPFVALGGGAAFALTRRKQSND
jgi:MFS transporter, AAHS family, 3-hydroxyphenylpropionic acid transporter